MNATHVWFELGDIKSGIVRKVTKADHNNHKYVFVYNGGRMFFNSTNDSHVKNKLFKLSKPV